jgi:hypothetical protein
MFVVSSLAWAGGAKLNGKWLLTYDPDGPVTEDWLLFRQEGGVELGGADGVYLTCPYHLNGDSVILTCKVRGKTRQLIMSGRDNHRELVNPSGAIYTRQ